MTTVGDNTGRTGSPRYRALRDLVQSTDDTVPGKFEITREGIVHDLVSPNGPHELTRSRLRKRLEALMPEEIVAHTGEPDVEDEPEGIMRRPDVMVISEAEMEGDGSFDPRTGSGAVLTGIHPTPDGPRYATRKDFVYGEDVTIGEWTIATDGLPRYAAADR
ncbi:Uma2 family endonuclease [Streptomyces sp. NPDC048288]|uniref:Uma2 family endonuclease n=1 Tax=Streptomyces sp. NPDC048288 TaxID=3365529 RepID=UPI0037141E65